MQTRCIWREVLCLPVFLCSLLATTRALNVGEWASPFREWYCLCVWENRHQWKYLYYLDRKKISIVLRKDNFFCLTNQISPFCIVIDGFQHVLKTLLMEKSKSKVLLASMKLLINFENPFITPCQRSFRCNLILRMLTGNRLWCRKFFWKPAMIRTVHWGKSTNSREARSKIYQWQGRKARQKFWCGFRKKIYSRIRKCFQRSKQKLSI